MHCWGANPSSFSQKKHCTLGLGGWAANLAHNSLLPCPCSVPLPLPSFAFVSCILGGLLFLPLCFLGQHQGAKRLHLNIFTTNSGKQVMEGAMHLVCGWPIKGPIGYKEGKGGREMSTTPTPTPTIQHRETPARTLNSAPPIVKTPTSSTPRVTVRH